MTIEQILTNGRIGEVTFQLCKKIVCKDGFQVSIQAGDTHYCWPRENGDYSIYSEFEIGFPSEEEDLILSYAESPERPTQTVYGYVPKSVVESMLEKHGGFSHYAEGGK